MDERRNHATNVSADAELWNRGYASEMYGCVASGNKGPFIVGHDNEIHG